MSEGLVARRDLRGERWRVPIPPRHVESLTGAALAMAAFAIAASFWSVELIRAALAQAGAITAPWLGWALYILIGLAVGLLLPAFYSLQAARRTRRAIRAADIIQARVDAAKAKNAAWCTLGYGLALLLLLGIGLFITANDVAVGKTFFYMPLILDSFNLILHSFGINVFIFCVAELLVLVWGLMVALARFAPGTPGRALRLLAIAYTDLFRGLPSIITLYLIGFGLPLTGMPLFQSFEPEYFAILALTLTYGAYVAEVYRAGIESIHWSQVAAARSLGLSFLQTMRFVIVPQALRRIGPPLLNDFIGLQKDTALVNVIGAIDAFNQSKIVAANHFNLSPVTSVAFLFVIILIPQTRFVDWLSARDQARRRAQG